MERCGSLKNKMKLKAFNLASLWFSTIHQICEKDKQKHWTYNEIKEAKEPCNHYYVVSQEIEEVYYVIDQDLGFIIMIKVF